MVPYQYPAYRLPAALRRPVPAMKGVSNPTLGQIGAMTVGDWLLLVGGGIVGGAGVNALIRQFSQPRVDAISIALGLVLTAVGGTVFVQKFGKLIA